MQHMKYRICKLATSWVAARFILNQDVGSGSHVILAPLPVLRGGGDPHLRGHLRPRRHPHVHLRPRPAKSEYRNTVGE